LEKTLDDNASRLTPRRDHAMAEDIRGKGFDIVRQNIVSPF
jgi:isocitrate/isopropylmalate dehydrogenase